MTTEQGRAGRRTGGFGVLLIDKPAGPTSFDVVGWVRWALGERSVGHCGTLDPAASGLLVVCVGGATKIVEHLTAVDKRYHARFVLGRSTTTADADGETIDEVEIPEATLDDLFTRADAALAELVGIIELPPPAFSAIRVDGKRAHKLARAGEAPELAPRSMTVEQLVVTDRGRDGASVWIDVDLTVAKGTYVRSLAEELGRRVELPAHLGALRRLACGDLSLEDPLALTSLCAHELPSDEGRAPRWRIKLAEEPEPEPEPEPKAPVAEPDPADQPARVSSRERAAAALRAGMVEPWRRLPFPFSDLRGPNHGPLLVRLIQGQRLRADAKTGAALGLPESLHVQPFADDGVYALVDRAAGQMIVVRREPDGRGSQRLATVRVVRFEPEPSGG